MEDLLSRLGQRVRAERHGRELTVKSLSEASGLSVRYLVELENGRGNISVGRLSQLARSLELPLAELLAEDAAPLSARVRRLTERLSDLDEAGLDRVEAALDGAADGGWLPGKGGALMRPPILALMGVRGAGKSTVGRQVAQRLELPFVELDGLIEEAAGLELADIFGIHGAPYYRRVEHEVLSGFIGEAQRSAGAVLATGGSLVTHPESWTLLRRSATTVWLKARAHDHWARVIAQGDDRPMRDSPQAFAQLETLLAEREPLYREASQAVDTTGRSVDEVVEAVVQAASVSLSPRAPNR